MNQNSTENLAVFDRLVAKISPAAIALIVQVTSLILTSVIAIFSELKVDYLFSTGIYVACQAVFAAFFSFLLNMDWWWRAIQFLFPILVIFFASSKIPSIYYLFAFIILILVYWSSFRTRVPYFPSKASLLPTILELMSLEKSINFIDVGSGMGGLLIELSNANEKSRFSGIEIAPFPWLVSFLRGKYCQSRVHFFFGNYEKIHLAEYDVVFAYLSPIAMPQFWIKAKREMRSGTILLSYEFLIADVKPDLCINKDPNDPSLYIWRI